MDQVFATFLLRMRMTGHTCTSNLNIDSKIEFRTEFDFFANLTTFRTLLVTLRAHAQKQP